MVVGYCTIHLSLLTANGPFCRNVPIIYTIAQQSPVIHIKLPRLLWRCKFSFFSPDSNVLWKLSFNILPSSPQSRGMGCSCSFMAHYTRPQLETITMPEILRHTHTHTPQHTVTCLLAVNIPPERSCMSGEDHRSSERQSLN